MLPEAETVVAQPLDFTRIYSDQADYVRRVLQRMGIRPADLDDMVQDTFVTIYRLLPSFEGRATVETWLYAVCWRIAAQYHRRARPRDFATDVSPSSFSIDGEFSAARMMASLEGVAPRDLDAFVLHEIGGLSISELSEMTGKARATLRRHVDRARKAIKGALRHGMKRDKPAKAASAEPRLASDAPRIFVTPEFCISHQGNTILCRWRGPSSVPALETLYDVLDRAGRETPDLLSFISVVEPDAPPPDRDGRAVIRRCIELIGERVAAAAFLALGPGPFALIPPIINAATFLSRTRINTRFFSDQRLALEWLAQSATDGATFESLTSHAAVMERLIDEAEAAFQNRCSFSPSKNSTNAPLHR